MISCFLVRFVGFCCVFLCFVAFIFAFSCVFFFFCSVAFCCVLFCSVHCVLCFVVLFPLCYISLRVYLRFVMFCCILSLCYVFAFCCVLFSCLHVVVLSFFAFFFWGGGWFERLSCSVLFRLLRFFVLCWWRRHSSEVSKTPVPKLTLFSPDNIVICRWFVD